MKRRSVFLTVGMVLASLSGEQASGDSQEATLASDKALRNKHEMIKKYEVFLKLAQQCEECQKIKHVLTKAADGTKRMNIADMLKLEVGIKRLQSGKRGRGDVTYKDEYYTIQQLVDLEEDGALNDSEAYREALDQALTKFERLYEGYLKQARGFKALLLDLIRQWADQRERKDSMLIDWGKQSAGHESEKFRQFVKSFKNLNSFLDDLKMFVGDLRFTCEQSTREFVEDMQQRIDALQEQVERASGESISEQHDNANSKKDEL